MAIFGECFTPYLGYPNFCISLSQVSAYWVILKPFFMTPDEKPKFGRDGATTSNAGDSLPPTLSRGRSLETSRKLPGPAYGE